MAGQVQGIGVRIPGATDPAGVLVLDRDRSVGVLVGGEWWCCRKGGRRKQIKLLEQGLQCEEATGPLFACPVQVDGSPLRSEVDGADKTRVQQIRSLLRAGPEVDFSAVIEG